MTMQTINLWTLNLKCCFSKFRAKALIVCVLLFGINVFSQTTNIEIKLENFDQCIPLVSQDTCVVTRASSFSIYWSLPDSLAHRFKYRLFPHSTEWSAFSKRNSIAFFEVPTGLYTFQLKCENGHEFEYCINVNESLIGSPKAKVLIFSILLMIGFVFVLIIFKSKLRSAKLAIERELKRAFSIKQQATIERSGVEATHVVDQARIRSRKYNKVTVLFADIEGFTKIAEHLNPEVLIDELDRFFFFFDGVVEKYGIEKIKTIGDAYMCAGGIPNKNRTNPVEVVMAALEMQSFMDKNKETQSNEKGFWKLRIGIHTGPVISGVVGQKKLSFDIWGDSVNIASRMESSGIAGEINVSGVTYQFIKEFFVCEYRGKMPIKYKGETDMYFVKGLLPELSIDDLGFEPNRTFFIRLQNMRFIDIEEYVLTKLENELSNGVFYHNREHTSEVLSHVEIIARGENVSEEDLLLLKTAALLHDVGFLIEYNAHENSSVEFAREILPKYNYIDYQIEQIVELIEVTKEHYEPHNFLERIIKDADLYLWGSPDLIRLSELEFQELEVQQHKQTFNEWNIKQIERLEKHRYYTSTANNLRQISKERQIQKLRCLLES